MSPTISRVLLCLFFVSCVASDAPGSVIANKNGDDGAPDIPGSDETIISILNYGAKQGGQVDTTQAFMDAWKAACHGSGGKTRLVVPKGVFRLGPVVFQGPCKNSGLMIVQVLGTIKASSDISEYSSPEWVLFENINGLRVIGDGTFDGQGEDSWKYNDCDHNSDCQLLPTSLKFSKITDGLVRGIRSVNSKSFHIFVSNSNNFRAQHLTITAPQESPNTDGIHISESDSVNVTNSNIGTGDDCVSIGQGSTNVLVTKVFCGPGHGISVGSLGKYENEKDVKFIHVKNCTFNATDNGVRIKTWAGSPPSSAMGFTFEDLFMDDTKNPVIIDQQYSCSDSCQKSPSKVRISNVQFRNIWGTSKLQESVKFMCSKDFPCEDVKLYNLNLNFGSEPTTATCMNANVEFPGKQIPLGCS